MIKTRHLFLVVSLLLMMSACDTQKTPQVEGNYTYEHAFNYDMEGNHFDVSETGTMVTSTPAAFRALPVQAA